MRERPNSGFGYKKNGQTYKREGGTEGLASTKGHAHKERQAEQWGSLQQKAVHTKRERPNSGFGYKKNGQTYKREGGTEGLASTKGHAHKERQAEQWGWLQPQAVHTKRERPNSGFGYKKYGQTYKREGGTEGLASTKGHAHKERQAEQWGSLQPKAVHTKRERPNSGFGHKEKSHAHKEGQAKQWG